MNIQKLIVYAWLLLDIIGMSIIIPAFPELKAYYHISDFQVTLGLTVYSLFSFLAAPVLGQLSDKFGRKKMLSRSIAGTALSNIVINGITGGNINILQAILTDISKTPEERKKNYGLMWAFFGVWFIIGPLLWSLLLKHWGVEGIFWFGTIFAIIELILIMTKFHNTNTLDHDRHLSYNAFRIIWKYFHKDGIKTLLLSMFFLGVWVFIVNSGQSLLMHTRFGTTGSQYGVYMAIMGVIMAVNLGLLIPKFWTKHFDNKQIIRISHIAFIIGYTLVWLSGNLTRYLGLFFITIIIGNIYMPIYNVEIMSKALPNEVGEISGMLGGAQSIFMFFGPLIGGIMLSTQYNIFYGSAICFALSLIVMIRYLTRNKNNS
jgi:MFS family permease